MQSAYAVLTHLDRKKYEIISIGITREGRWFRYYGEEKYILDDTWQEKECNPAWILPDRVKRGILECTKEGVQLLEIDGVFPVLHGKNGEDGTIQGLIEMAGLRVKRGILECTKEGVQLLEIDGVFPVLHGKNGEDGTIQGLIEMAGLRVIGCGMLSSALCMDKDKAHQLVEKAGISVPRAVVLKSGEKAENLTYPVFVKPVRAGSSFGITKVEREEDLEKAVEMALAHDDEVIIEENIEGFEVGCAVLGNDELLVGRVDEIELSKGFFDFTEKYTLQSSKIHMPARIDEKTEEEIRQTAKKIYRTLSCKGFARVDMFLTPDKEIVFNEVNTIPGFTSHSRYPNMMKGIGLSFEEVLEKLISLEVR